MTELDTLAIDHLAEALHALHKARKAVQEEKIVHREAVVHELTRAELSVSRAISLMAGAQ